MNARRTTGGRFQEVVLDSSPLVNLLGLNYMRKTDGPPQPDPKRILTGDAAHLYIDGRPENQKSFLLLFDSIPVLHTTSHVIGELQGLSRKMKLNETERKRFWSDSIDYLIAHKLDEHRVSLLELADNETYRMWVGIIGPADAGLVHLAQSKGIPLLTDDHDTLYGFALQMGVDCHLVQNLIELSTR